MYDRIQKGKRSLWKKTKDAVNRAKLAVKDRYGTEGGLARLAGDVAVLKTAVNSERKYWDRVSLVQSTLSSTAPIILAVPWDDLTEGSGPQQRNGDQVKVLWTTFKCIFTNALTSSGAGSAIRVRVMAILDTEPRGNNPVTAVQLRDAVLQTTNTGPLQMTSPYKTSQTATWGAVGDRWKILSDEVFTIDNVNQKSYCYQVALNHQRNRNRGLRVKYIPTPDDNPADDRLYIIAMTDTGTTLEVLVDGEHSRMCFVDN